MASHNFIPPLRRRRGVGPHPRSAALLYLLFSSLASCTVVTNDTGIAAGKTFDYIIAGSGLSGLTVGNKVRFVALSPLPSAC